jgi:hypothetical protein
LVLNPFPFAFPASPESNKKIGNDQYQPGKQVNALRDFTPLFEDPQQNKTQTQSQKRTIHILYRCLQVLVLAKVRKKSLQRLT